LTHSPRRQQVTAMCAQRTAGLAIIADREEGYLSLSWRLPMREPEPEKLPIGIPLPDMTFLSWRAPMREPEPEIKPIGIPLPSMTFDQLHDLEDDWSMREERV
jgi:hypothetical protein